MISIVAAVSTNGIIGKDGDLPWGKLKDDLDRFKELTLGHTVVQGHKTLCSIVKRLHKPLPGRRNIVLTRHPESVRIDGVEVFTNFDQVIELSKSREIFVIGGADLYRLALPVANSLYLTRVHAQVEGDVRFPAWNKNEWVTITTASYRQNQFNAHPFTWTLYRRKMT